MHSFGPYGNVKDCKVQQFIGVPLLKLSCNSSTLCGEDQVDYKLQEPDKRSHQNSWSTTLNSVTNEVNYLQASNAVIKTGVPNHKGAHIPLRSSFDWDFLKENSKDYHDKALVDYITFWVPSRSCL